MHKREPFYPTGNQWGEVNTFGRNNKSIVITSPEKGSRVVILDYHCYVNKMMTFLDETSKFVNLGPVKTSDHATSIETKFQRNLVMLVERGLLSSPISNLIKPTGSIRPRLYGLPRTHKMRSHSDPYYH